MTPAPGAAVSAPVVDEDDGPEPVTKGVALTDDEAEAVEWYLTKCHPDWPPIKVKRR